MSVARQDPTVTRRYFYSIKEISIGGRCMCNGHAEACDIPDPRDNKVLLCNCRHNTCGAKCNTCCTGFEQKAWKISKHDAPFICELANNQSKNAKTRKSMPPIVIDGKTKDQTTLIKDLKEYVKGQFSVKHTNATTIIFVDEKDDHMRVINNIKAEKLAYHTYTSSDDKSHAFVLRGLAEGTKIADIEADLEEEHEIKARSIFQMNTKERPLFLVVTDPAITLEYLNKNTRIVLHTRLVSAVFSFLPVIVLKALVDASAEKNLHHQIVTAVILDTTVTLTVNHAIAI
ncbi:unnamed protein product [Psylliodes chrysocephalus]|uniref:Laminin N-terminal domain-containing protein n=1 Tax=Psylliodes chrysocephalus TaxID=3402493 RepID=A0A9P0GN32_9CUCU|nr:unnamed protein product [Psylliodes chrysocephala]